MEKKKSSVIFLIQARREGKESEKEKNVNHHKAHKSTVGEGKKTARTYTDIQTNS